MVARFGSFLIRQLYHCLIWAPLERVGDRARIHGRVLQPKRAFFEFTRLVLSRVKAHGAKWRRWYLNQHYWQKGTRKEFPAKQHGDNALIQIDEEATYEIHPEVAGYVLEAKMAQQRAERGEE